MAVKNKKIILAIILVFVITGLFLYRVKIKRLMEDALKTQLPKEANFQNPVAEKHDSVTETENLNIAATMPTARQEAKTLPLSYNLNIPFTMQAPYSDWSEPWQNTCEEANILMVRYYYQGQTLTKKIAKAELEKLINWQNQNFGSYVDTDIQQMAEMAEKIWNYKTQIIDNPTVKQIKTTIAEGMPVIMPTAGRELKNPYFANLGPVYHMVTVKGYTADGKFITNDPGIGKGHNYLYDSAVLMNAMHDWNGNEENILQGAKRILIILP